jgi:UDP-N-acetylmuramate: L-alanyl-gamma-D-glutamyl-meso-diaminopimelate ligase
MKIHILACGGAVMHNIAIALHRMGNDVSGSDDEIFDPALSRLKKEGISPEEFGWFPDKINEELDFIILGMHARPDNPELIKAKELNIKIYSFPEYVFEHSKNKIRVVIGGSHGKTTTTAMVMHVLNQMGKSFDYLVGSQLEGFDTMVKFSDAPIVIIEGDEYLTSALDPIPKFLKYKPHIAMITGIAWDHINVFPTFENYVEQFRLFIDSIEDGGKLIYFSGDPILNDLIEKSKITGIAYDTPKHHIEEHQVVIETKEEHKLEIFGEHNLQNAEGASLVCEALGIEKNAFYEALSSFKGTSKRLELVKKDAKTIIYRDFAHSPSKLIASVDAIRRQYPEFHFISVFELHTFSSLSKEFLPHYAHSMDVADDSIVYFNPHVFAHKKMQNIDKEYIKSQFGEKTLVIDDSKELISTVFKLKSNVLVKPCVLLFMSSGNFDNAQLL